jgi:hypothetical protein
MPVLAKSDGIVIRLLFGRSLGACLRASCGQSDLVVSLCPLDIIEGDAPPEVCQLVLAWAAQHQQELLTAWRQRRSGLGPKPIFPLFSTAIQIART